LLLGNGGWDDARGETNGCQGDGQAKHESVNHGERSEWFLGSKVAVNP
jgi:hypothetical protein